MGTAAYCKPYANDLDIYIYNPPLKKKTPTPLFHKTYIPQILTP